MLAIRANFHTHSTFCDGNNTIKEMTESALEKGFDILGFSGHLDPGVAMQDTDGYKRAVSEMRMYCRGRMQILRGAELDTVYGSDCKALVDAEYTIGSTHFVPVPGSPVWEAPAPFGTHKEGSPDWDLIGVDGDPMDLRERCLRYYDGDHYRLAEDYFRFESLAAERLQPTFIGHFDLITRFNDLPASAGGHFIDETDPRYLRAAGAAIEKLVPTGIPFELNLGALNRGRKKEAYPAPPLLRMLKEAGAEILLSADAHDSTLIDGGFPEGIRAAKAAGFDHVLILTRVNTGRPALNTAQDASFSCCAGERLPLYWQEIGI